MADTKKFETGKTYETRSPCDHDCVISVTVLRRTDKTVTCRVSRGTSYEDKTLRPSVYRGAETVKPWGSYSMCPIVTAEVRS